MTALDDYRREEAARLSTTMTDLEALGKKAIAELEAEVARLNDICERLAEAGHSR